MKNYKGTPVNQVELPKAKSNTSGAIMLVVMFIAAIVLKLAVTGFFGA